MSLKGIPTERLLTWKKNVLKVRNDYKKGTHESCTESCVHCKESVTAVPNTNRCYNCSACIWKYMMLIAEGVFNTRPFCVANVISDMNSKSSYHDKQEHIDRCNLWIKIINKELKSRS